MSSGAPLNLTEPASGTTGWAATVNANFSAINAAIAALQAGGATGPTGPAGAAGAVGMIFAGQWATVVNYVVTDVVTFNGSSYIAIANNVNSEPDTHPSAWAPLALAGAAGPVGPTGPQGPAGASGGGTTVTFPITVAEGGTGATTSAGARAAIGAAASGQNGDITQLTAITTNPSAGTGPPGISIVSAGGNGTAINFDNGVQGGSISTGGIANLEQILCAGSITCGGLTCSALAQFSTIGNAVPGGNVEITCQLQATDGIVLQGATPSVSSGEIGLGTTTASTASAGGGAAIPSTVLTYLVINVGGVIGKIPVLAN